MNVLRTGKRDEMSVMTSNGAPHNGASVRPGPSAVEAAVAAVAAGRFVVVLDDADRENEADLIMAADHVTPEALAFMVRHTSGLVCVALTGERLDDLDLPLMVPKNRDSFGTAFTVSVDHRPGTTTGISAADRRPPPSGPWSTTPASRPISPVRVTCSRSGPDPAASSRGPVTPRPRSTSPASPGSPRPACSASS